jgi:subtilase family serine protease
MAQEVHVWGCSYVSCIHLPVPEDFFMNVRLVSLLLIGGLAAGCSGASSDDTASSAAAPAEDQALSAITTHASKRSCTTGSGRRSVHCMASVRTDVEEGYTPDFAAPADAFSPDHHPTSVAYGPADLQAAYGVPAGGGEGVTVAIVDAQDYPTAEADLAVYRAKYGLPPCTTANGCFKKLNASGGTTYPTPDYGWAQEIALDIQSVSAACPSCKILLLEGEENSPPAGETEDELDLAEDTAVAMGAKIISNSWGSVEATSEKNGGILEADAVAEAKHYIHAGVSIFAAVGDEGFATSPNNTDDQKGSGFPSDIPQVFSVGGTALTKSTTAARGWAEKVWGPGGDDGATNSGCSEFFPKPSYQKQTACKGRLDNDIAAVADPDTGFNIYITYVDPDTKADDYIPAGWNVFGGTSLASPVTAAIFAATGLAGVDPSYVYENEADFNDVTSGSNGTCKSQILCVARVGYDGPTGVGTPNGSKILGK